MTLTYSDDHLPDSLEEGWAHIEDFRRRMPDVPMMVVPEWGEETGRFHWHALLPKYLPKWQLEEAWRHRGWVDVRKIRSKTGGARSNARAAAHYCAKYLAKTFEEGQEGTSRTTGRRSGMKRYSTTKGTKVEPRRQRFRCRNEAFTWAMFEVAGGPSKVTGLWSSDDLEDWEGPPVFMVHWDDHGPP